MPTYRTIEPRTDRILKDWILKERLAFDLEPSLPVSELQAILPPRCKEQLGEFKPTDNVFRKMSQGFNRVSDVWIELMRFIGVSDFSPEQAILGTVSTFLDSENVRVKLNASYDTPHRKNSIEVLCLNEPTHQGLIRYEGDRLSFPPSIFEAVIDRRLNVYQLYCEKLPDLLLIPGVSDPHSLLIAENNARLAEEHRGSDEQPELDELDALSAEDPWINSPEGTIESIYKPDGSAVYEAEPSQDDIREHNELIGSLIEDTEPSDDAIALTLFGAAENDPDVQAQMLAEAIEDSVNGHGNSVDDEAELEAVQIEGKEQDTDIEEMANDDDYDRDQYMNRIRDEATGRNPIVLTPGGYPMLLDEMIAEQRADVRDNSQLTGSLLDEEASDDAITLTPFDGDANNPETTPFGGAVNPEVHHMISFNERAAKDAARTAESETEVETVDDTDADAEIEVAVAGHGSESDEVDGEVEKFDEDWDGTWPRFVTDEVE